MSRFISPFLGCALALSLLCSSAQAATSNVNLGNTATMATECVVNVTQSLMFGRYDPLVTHRTVKPTSQGVIKLDCALQTNASVRISNGLYADSYVSASRCTASPCYWGAAQYRTYSCARNMNGPGLLPYTISASAGGASSVNSLGEYYYSEAGGTQYPGSCTGAASSTTFASLYFNGFTSANVPVFGTITDTTTSSARPGSYSDSLVVSVEF